MTLATVQKRLEALHLQNRVAAGSLIVSVFGDAVLPRGGGIWLGSLIGLMEVLGINERLVRTSVFRLIKDEWLQTESHGRRANYQLTAVGTRRFNEASQHIYAAKPPEWDHHWRLVSTVGDMDIRTREALRRSMAWQGFGELAAGLFVHPSADLEVSLDALKSDGLAAALPQLLPLLAANPRVATSATNSDIVRKAWDMDLLAQGYTRFLAQYQPMLTELRVRRSSKLDAKTAFLARTLMIHDFRRLLLRDPELPAVLLPPHWPGQKARELCRALYLRLLPASEHYLDQHLQLATGEIPAASTLVTQRFSQQSA
jgi:phenylacetic acid degradation operon negative regulatory protein